MRLKSLVLAASAAALSVLGACGDQPTAPAAAADQAAEQRSAPTSVIDPSTGEAVATNYKPAGTVVVMPGVSALEPGARPLAVCTVYEPCEPCGFDQPCEPECDPNDPSGECYNPPPPPCRSLITNYTEYRAGIQPYSFLEVSGTASSSCGFLVVTGLGARINGSDDYTTLALRGRRVNGDGSWGETVDYRFGSSPNHSLEAFGEVPSGYAVTGVAIGQSGTEDVRTIVLSYRQVQLTAAGVRMTGPTYTARFGASPYNYTDASFVTYNDNEVFVGAGFRSIDDGERTATMAAFVGVLP